jgi:hypothetical protein
VGLYDCVAPCVTKRKSQKEDHHQAVCRKFARRVSKVFAEIGWLLQPVPRQKLPMLNANGSELQESFPNAKGIPR